MAQRGKNEQYGEPDEWEFDYPSATVLTGFWLWAMSNFQRLPTQDEVISYDAAWISDMKLAYLLYSFQANESPISKMFEEYMAYKESPNTYKGQRQILNQMDTVKSQIPKNVGKNMFGNS